MDATPREADLLRRADLTVAHRADVRFTCTSGRWPGSQITVAVDPAHVDAFVGRAAADVEALWPSRDTEDGALSLLAIHLESQLLTADAAPAHVWLDPGGRWVLRDAAGGAPASG